MLKSTNNFFFSFDTTNFLRFIINIKGKGESTFSKLRESLINCQKANILLFINECFYTRIFPEFL